jgi:hypothetical protein
MLEDSVPPAIEVGNINQHADNNNSVGGLIH